MLRSSWIWSVFPFADEKNRGDFGSLIIGSTPKTEFNLSERRLKQFENYLEEREKSHFTRSLAFVDICRRKEVDISVA